ncbi:spondin-1 isoform X2 [Phymastichus coffea]|uniref:spondin-1 isoform X2 n=1 Tax=Phymastichus coffea TaxID=108790 RepID=UPI00273A771B|nr:spondin-1 isoform X2 [Phymastichus coffea]
MLRLFMVSWFIATTWAGCPLSPTPEQTSADRLPGDGGYRILVSGNYDKYIPNAVYTISLQGPSDYERPKQFKRFTLSVDSQNAPFNLATRVGFFQIFPNSLIEFNEECVNTVSEVSDYPKTEVQVMWRAPPAGSGCVIFTAMVMENSHRWFAEDSKLSKTFCEMSTNETESLDELRCCACDDAKYKLVLEGLWSSKTHPKDFPEQVWLTHFSDLVGASHETNFSFWGREQIATDGFRQLAEWGSASGLEAEMRNNAQYLRTYIKAPGLWYPNVNTNTSATFNVDRKHPLVSVASMFGPSPDWVVGVSKLNLCQRDCTWIKGMAIDLYPWDAGTDSGITYMSPNAETNPREYMKPITTMYPEDPRAPFYDPSGQPMLPLARLYLDREEIKKRSCDDSDLEDLPAEFYVKEETGDERPECMTTEFSEWTKCSVTCGKGIRMRTRGYRIPEKAAMMGCTRQLVSKEMCLAPAGECSGEDSSSGSLSPFPDLNEAECLTGDWSEWSECSSSCGMSYKTRRRHLQNPANRKKCFHVSLIDKQKCVAPPCSSNEQEDAICRVSDWSDWSPCSASCVICKDKPEKGPCRGYFERWAFDSEKGKCVPFAYGGCRGNRNNFNTFSECSTMCDVVKETSSGIQPTVRSVVPRQLSNDRIATRALDEVSSVEEPINCQVSNWSPWTKCSVSCGNGRVTSTRTIIRQPANGGRRCPKRMTRRARCQLAPCD